MLKEGTRLMRRRVMGLRPYRQRGFRTEDLRNVSLLSLLEYIYLFAPPIYARPFTNANQGCEENSKGIHMKF